MSNSLGEVFRITSFGESHGRCVGIVVDGCPAGLAISRGPGDAPRGRDAEAIIPAACPE